MNQDKYSRLLETLKNCQFPNAEKHVNDFKNFLKHQDLNNKIDSMIDEAHRKKISDEEFAAMIEEQKQIMRELGVKMKEPPSPVKKPDVNSISNIKTQAQTSNKPNEKMADEIKIYNINEIINYRIEGDRFYLFGPRQEKVEKVKLNTGQVVHIENLNSNQKEELSESLSKSVTSLRLPPKLQKNNNLEKSTPILKKPTQPVKKPTPPLKKPTLLKKPTPLLKKPTPSLKKPTLLKKPTPLKKPKETKKSVDKPKRKRTKRRKSNKYWYHRLPEYPMKNVTKVKGRRLRLPKKKKTIKALKVNKKGEKVPFKGFLDYFKI